MATMDQIQGLNEALAGIRAEFENLQKTVFSDGDIQNKIAEGARTLDSSNSTQHPEIRKEMDVVRTNIRDAVKRLED